jgi:hypothetical protein
MFVKRENINSSIIVKRNLPINIIEDEKYLFINEMSRSFDGCYKIDEKNCLIFGQNIFSIKKISFFIKETFFGYPSFKKILKETVKNFLKIRKFKIISSGVWITDNKSNIYFHWLCDALQKIVLIKNLENKKILIPEEFLKSQFIVETLNLLNVTFLPIDKNTLYFAKDLTIMGETAPTGNYNPDVLKALQQKFFELNLSKNNLSQKNKKYWILRDNDKREIENSNEIYQILKSYGFEFIYFEKLSILEKIKILNNTLYLGGIFGSGLTNMLFLNKEANLIEIRNENDSMNNAFFSMANALDLNYFYFISKFKGYKKIKIFIDPIRFDIFLSNIGLVKS